MLKEIIHRNLITAEPNTTVSEAAKLMAKHNVGCVLVLDNEKPRGLITDRDIVVRCVAKNVDVDDCTLENIMSESLTTVKETDGVFDCVRAMHAAGVRRIPVVDANGKAVGILSFGDLLAILSRELNEMTQTTTPAEELDDDTKLIKAS